jgi:hypothetical protein
MIFASDLCLVLVFVSSFSFSFSYRVDLSYFCDLALEMKVKECSTGLGTLRKRLLARCLP